MNTTMHCSDCFGDSAKSRWGIWKPFQGSASHRSMILGHKASSRLEALCPKIIERWEAEPWKGYQIPPAVGGRTPAGPELLPQVVREPVGDAGDRRLIAPPTFPGGLEVHLLEHRRVEFHRGEVRQSGPQILGDDAVILAVARRGKTLLCDDGGGWGCRGWRRGRSCGRRGGGNPCQAW